MHDQNDYPQSHSDQSDYNEDFNEDFNKDETIATINSIINHSNETSDIYDTASYYEPDHNLVQIDDYKEYLRNSLAEELSSSFVEFIDWYFNPLQYVYEEKSTIFG